MATGTFTVDLDWLDQFCNQLTSSTCSLEAALSALKETGPIRTGHDDLDKACLTFHDRWDDGLDMMNKSISAMSEKVRICVRDYRRTETTLTSAYPASGPSVPGTTQSAAPTYPHITTALG
ncbi:hypothetical protein LO772_11985 [Yinghuangia sp. ASG 101]|uniref:hypothetical protein n=1 Tax=Yinghuangia sp. ASG 101 TaxID=2896848 RepID=UPI001E3FC4C0|nr:hypothetical protein [Yinghuangia sp. ASG 101]UGQ14242.1 hypothetical protein LO772_11985 [Yinghuangia sp. ASG 101]